MSDPEHLERLRNESYVRAGTRGAPVVLGGLSYRFNRPQIKARYLAHRSARFGNDNDREDEEDAEEGHEREAQSLWGRMAKATLSPAHGGPEAKQPAPPAGSQRRRHPLPDPPSAQVSLVHANV